MDRVVHDRARPYPVRGGHARARHARCARRSAPRERAPAREQLHDPVRSARPGASAPSARPGALRRQAGGARRRRDARAGQGSGRGAGRPVRRGAARRRVLRRASRVVHTGQRRGGQGRRRGRTRRVRGRGGRPVQHPRRAPQPDGTARRDRSLGRRSGRRDRLQPGQQVGGGRTGQAVLARPGVGARALRAHRWRLRVQGDPPARGARGHGCVGPAPPGPRRTDPPADVLARRLPQPHGAARQAGCRPRRAAARARSRGGVPHLDRARIRRARRRLRTSAVRRERPPHRDPGGRARRSDSDVDACAGRGAGVVRPGVGARRTRREVRHRPDRPAPAQRTGRGSPVRTAVQQPQSPWLLRGGRPPVRLGGPRSAARCSPRGPLAARHRHGRGGVPDPVGPRRRP